MTKNLLIKCKILIVFIYNQNFAFTQNLIPNGSFENICECPTFLCQTQDMCCVEDWYGPLSSTFGTPDIHSLCSNSNIVGLPNNVHVNNLYPRTGEYIAGSKFYATMLENNSNKYYETGEYLTVKLTNKLIKNKKYCLSFFYSCSSETELFFRVNIKSWGILFSEDSPIGTDRINSHEASLLYNENFLDTTSGWHELNFNYIANGGEQYFTIGYEFLNSEIDTLHLVSFSGQARTYLFFDDFFLECCDPLGCDEVSTGEAINTNKFNIFPNPTSAQVNIVFSEPVNNIMSYNITDLQGRQMMQGNIVNQQTILDVSIFAKGIYLLSITDEQGNKWNKKIVKTE